MKLMFLCHGAGNGGAERVITSLASGFAKKGYEVYMITTKTEDYEYKIANNVIRITINSERNTVIGRSIDRITKLRNLIKSVKPKCIISFSTIPNLQAIIANNKINTRLIISERTDPRRYPTSNIGKMLRTILYPRADVIVFQTPDAKKYFNKKIQDKGVIIPNPVRNDLPNPFQGDRKHLIVGIGSLGEQKHWIIGLKAMEIFLKHYPDYKLKIYGNGPQRIMLQNYIDNSQSLKNHAFLMGFSDKAVEEMNDAMMFISSSDYDGIPNSMLEAMATGVPTIYTDCPVGGPRMFIKSYENGILVPINNPQKLAEAMVEIASNPALRKKLSNKSVKIKESLDIKKIILEWEKLI